MILSSADSGDAKLIADVILTKLTKAGLTSSKILIQVHDGASVMAKHYKEVQGLLQEQKNRKIPNVHCLNHQLYLAVVHAISVAQAINDFLYVWGSHYVFFRGKPTI